MAATVIFNKNEYSSAKGDINWDLMTMCRGAEAKYEQNSDSMSDFRNEKIVLKWD